MQQTAESPHNHTKSFLSDLSRANLIPSFNATQSTGEVYEESFSETISFSSASGPNIPLADMGVSEVIQNTLNLPHFCVLRNDQTEGLVVPSVLTKLTSFDEALDRKLV